MKVPYYTPESKVSDMLRDNYRRSILFDLFEIEYSYDDDISIGEICAANRTNVDILLLVCNLYTYDEYSVEDNVKDDFPVAEAIKYIFKVHDFFIHRFMSDVKMKFGGMKSFLSGEDNRALSGLFETFWLYTEEHLSNCNKLFRQYLEQPESVASKQVEYLMELKSKINRTTDVLIKHMSEAKVPEEYEVQVGHLKFYLINLRKDFNRHDELVYTTFRRMMN